MYKCASWQLVNIVLKKLEDRQELNSIPSYTVRCVKQRNLNIFMLGANDALIGNCIAVNQQNFWEIIYLEIDPEHQQSGLGTFLLQFVSHSLWEDDFNPIRITPNNPEEWLIKWLFNMGFAPAQTGYERKQGDYNYGTFRSPIFP